MNNCIFCNVIKGAVPTEFIYKDEEVVAFADVNPKAPVHILVVPVKHFVSISDAEVNDAPLLGKMLLVIKDVTEKLGIAKTGYKVICNNGSASGQFVFHLHFHVLGGWKTQEYWDV
jgi:histidine triad (HIT) family protein